MNPRLRRRLQPLAHRFDRARRQISEIRSGDPATRMFAEFGARSIMHAPQLAILNPGSIAIGDDVLIYSHVWMEALAPPGTVIIRMGKGSAIGYFARVVALNGIVFGDRASLGHHSSLSDTVHIYKDVEPDVSGWSTPLKVGRPLVMEEGATIGNNCVVTGGITIGANAVIAPNSVITRNVPPDTIIGGNPARVLRRKRPNGKWEWLIDPASLDLEAQAAIEPPA